MEVLEISLVGEYPWLFLSTIFFRLLQTLSILNVRDEALFQLAAQKLKSEKNFLSPTYIAVLKELIIFNVYVEEILAEILNDKFYERLKGLRKLNLLIIFNWRKKCEIFFKINNEIMII